MEENAKKNACTRTVSEAVERKTEVSKSEATEKKTEVSKTEAAETEKTNMEIIDDFLGLS